jgi:uncharacterized coiled-coil protein SlyX
LRSETVVYAVKRSWIALSHQYIKECRVQENEGLGNRVTELEIRCMQLQHDFDALNGVVLEQQRELLAWRAAFARFETRLQNLSDPEPPRDPLAERPPHY